MGPSQGGEGCLEGTTILFGKETARMSAEKKKKIGGRKNVRKVGNFEKGGGTHNSRSNTVPEMDPSPTLKKKKRRGWDSRLKQKSLGFRKGGRKTAKPPGKLCHPPLSKKGVLRQKGNGHQNENFDQGERLGGEKKKKKSFDKTSGRTTAQPHLSGKGGAERVRPGATTKTGPDKQF